MKILSIFLLTSKSKEALLTFSNPHHLSGRSREEEIPPNASTVEANGGHALKRKKTTKEKKHVSMLLVWCLEDSAVQLVLKLQH